MKNFANSLNLAPYGVNSELIVNENFLDNDGIRSNTPNSVCCDTKYFPEGSLNGIHLLELFSDYGGSTGFIYTFQIYRRDPQTQIETLTYSKPVYFGIEDYTNTDVRDKASFIVAFQNNMDYRFVITTSNNISCTNYLSLDEMIFTPKQSHDVMEAGYDDLWDWDDLPDVLNGIFQTLYVIESGYKLITGDNTRSKSEVVTTRTT